MNEFHGLAADLRDAGATAGVRAVPVMHRAGNNIVRDARDHAPGDREGPAKHYPATITYDLEVEKDRIVVEVGPDRELNGQAKLGNLFEHGASARPPRPHIGPAGDREDPKVLAHLAEIGGEKL